MYRVEIHRKAQKEIKYLPEDIREGFEFNYQSAIRSVSF
ncbi:hypothetical protein ABOONEI_2965 [Aciduliprofundum boonei T469]|nr:hypothetical protein ABOONEI_14 [Aciduliprofundum boonei T469]EDY34910.1 hypothetical protein ABOONEI_1176 [Aciduliprofundum boonei T469]EDY36004.1 hypothetical protein ABOONEI_2965 [Aciduliprofundum boonei T469]